MAEATFITSHVQQFRERKRVLSLLKAFTLVVRQRRTLELIYGAYCTAVRRPSKVFPCDVDVLNSILEKGFEYQRRAIISRADLIQLYGGEFSVHSLPQDFEVARLQNICRRKDCLIIGEYGENSRIALVTPTACHINDHYRRVSGVRHIHAVVSYGDAEELLVTTGDSAKVLDLWTENQGALRFVRRLRMYLAGFTAVARMRGEYYFGSDFSGRPNFIETLQGTKYFFPEKAYKLYVSAFFTVVDRYLVSVNTELKVSGGRRALSIFDVVEKKFVFCDYL